MAAWHSYPCPDMDEHTLRLGLPAAEDTDLVTLPELAESSGLSLPLLEALAREGLLVARETDPPRFHAGDAEAVRAGLDMVGAGLPLAELLEVARQADRALKPVAEMAVDTFVRFVSDPLEVSTDDAEEAQARLVAALETMLPAAGRLVAHHFQRLLVDGARRRLEQ